MANTDSQRAIYACPIAGNSYCESLYSSARSLGIDVREAIWSGRWLLGVLRAGDTLHIHWPSFLYYDPSSRFTSAVGLCRFIALSLALRLRGVRFVWTAHNLYPHDGGKSDWMHRVARRFIVRIASRIFVHGETAATIVGKEFGVDRSRMQIIPHGHWIAAYPNTIDRATARRRLELTQESRVFLFIGLCKPYKGLEALVELFGRIRRDAILLVVGKFPSFEYQTSMVELAARSGGSRVRVYPGFVQEADLQVFLNAADVVVLPYRDVLTSGAAMLAMSFGRPVVAPRLGALVDLIEEGCGTLYESTEQGALPAALEAACTTPFDPDRILAVAAKFKWEDAALALADAHGLTAVDGQLAEVTTETRR